MVVITLEIPDLAKLSIFTEVANPLKRELEYIFSTDPVLKMKF